MYHRSQEKLILQEIYLKACIQKLSVEDIAVAVDDGGKKHCLLW